MKEFDLESAKAGAKVQTRNGRKARIVCYDVNSDKYPLLVLVSNKEDNRELPYLYTIDGKTIINSVKQDVFDLVMAPETHIKYSNFYKTTDGSIWNGIWHNTIEEAKEDIEYENVEDSEYFTTLEVELEY